MASTLQIFAHYCLVQICMVGWLAGKLVGWLVGFVICLIGLLVGCLNS